MVSHWDDVRARDVEIGEVRGRWRRFGSPDLGVRRLEVAPGARSMPVHVHAETEEFFFVVGGSGLLWQDARTWPLDAGDFVHHPAKRGAHTLLAGEDGLDVLAFGAETGADMTWLPRAGVFWAGPHWLPPGGQHPFEAEAAAGPLEQGEPLAERPANVVPVGEIEAVPFGRGDVSALRRYAGEVVGSRTSGIGHFTVAPGMLNAPPHCHSVEEEIFVVLEGDGELLLGDDGAERHPLRAGSLVLRPPGTGVAHAFRAGAHGMTLLGYGTRDPGDICFYPRSQKVSLRGVRAVFRVERVDYWDGEH